MSIAASKSSTSKKCCRCRTNKPLHGASRCRGCQDIVNTRQRELRAARQASGLCKCGRAKPRTGRADCEICYQEMAKSSNVTYRNRKLAGLCVCGADPVAGGKTCQTCRDASQRKQARIRRKVLSHYGLACACCGEDTYEFLEIDHVDGDGKGNDHRREIGYSAAYRWLIKNGFPPGFQTLCSNCNRAKFRYGVCPHQRKRAEEKTT